MAEIMILCAFYIASLFVRTVVALTHPVVLVGAMLAAAAIQLRRVACKIELVVETPDNRAHPKENPTPGKAQYWLAGWW